MNDASHALQLEDLLEHSDWLSRFARHLLQDPHAADDAVQSTWESTLRNPPAEHVPVRGWLATVLRNKVLGSHRSDTRRRNREVRYSSAASGMEVDTSVERADIGQALVKAILRLQEPLRTTILLLSLIPI